MEKTTLNTILNKEISKGDVFQIAKISELWHQKETSSIIPMSPYNYRQSNINILPDLDKSRVFITISYM